MIPSLTSYYHNWYHGKPVAITSARRQELERLHSILYEASEFFCLNYREFVPEYMPLGERDMEILELQEAYPFRAGTWRPDYIITADGALKICEITSRFFAHGIFSNWYSEEASRLFMEKHFPGEEYASTFPAMMDYMMEILEGKREIFVLKSADRTSEIKMYDYFYTQQGCSVTVIESPEVEARRHEWARPGVFLVSALNQADILSFSLDTLKAMADAGMYSEFRNTFLIHDKRFMRLWFKDCFTSRFLSAEDAAFLRDHAIPTYICSEGGPVIEDALRNKDSYILKPFRLGKSEGVHAGYLTDDRDWTRLMHTEGMLIQPFLSQRTYHTVWQGKEFDDYLCGMMLCVNERYFGSGMFRASSLPVTNIGDDRKACCIHTDDPRILALCDVL